MGLTHGAVKFYKIRIMPHLRRMLGIDELESNIYTFLNSATDITKCRPATGDLRALQLADAELLKIIDLLCRKNELTCWLDWGSLLGAVRHKGFIPWDDDLDVCIPGRDYKRAFSVITDFFAEKKEFAVSSWEQALESRIWVCYHNTGILIDIFPIESMQISGGASQEQIKNQVVRLRNSPDETKEQHTETDTQTIYYYPKKVWHKNGYFSEDDIFPLQEAEFEGMSVRIPHNSNKYLTTQYGDYMSYPRNCVLKHKLLVDAAVHSGSDRLKEACENLKKLRLELEQTM